MASSGMLRRVALVRTDVSEELSASIIRVTRIGELGATLAVTSNRRTSVCVFVEGPYFDGDLDKSCSMPHNYSAVLPFPEYFPPYSNSKRIEVFQN
jgi:hypothetical protein